MLQILLMLLALVSETGVCNSPGKIQYFILIPTDLSTVFPQLNVEIQLHAAIFPLLAITLSFVLMPGRRDFLRSCGYARRQW